MTLRNARARTVPDCGTATRSKRSSSFDLNKNAVRRELKKIHEARGKRSKGRGWKNFLQARNLETPQRRSLDTTVRRVNRTAPAKAGCGHCVHN
jgi:hypothetical protein